MSCGECSRLAVSLARTEAAAAQDIRTTLRRRATGRISAEVAAERVAGVKADLAVHREAAAARIAACGCHAEAVTVAVASLAGSGDSVASEGRTGGAS